MVKYMTFMALVLDSGFWRLVMSLSWLHSLVIKVEFGASMGV